jgi:hypothetical protein
MLTETLKKYPFKINDLEYFPGLGEMHCLLFPQQKKIVHKSVFVAWIPNEKRARFRRNVPFVTKLHQVLAWRWARL